MEFVPDFIKHGFLKYSGRGAAGLWAVLRALGKKGFDILMPAGICEIVPATVVYAGMNPVFCDVDAITGNSNFDHFKRAVTKNTVACIAVHNYGIPLEILDIESLKNWTCDKNIFFIEDVCNAYGADIEGKYAGTFSDAAFYSFGYAKIIDVGAGGAFIVKDKSLYRKASEIMDKLPKRSLEHIALEDEFNSALKHLRNACDKCDPGSLKDLYLKYLPHLIHRADSDTINKIIEKSGMISSIKKKRGDKADIYRNALVHPGIQHLPENPGSVCWRYSILVNQKIRNLLLAELRRNGVHASAWYPPVHTFFSENTLANDFPGAAEFGRKVINLWVDEKTSYDDIQSGVKIVMEFLNKSNRI